jgi:hypothetical protein
LEELPSLKEFEQLAQAALGSDDGIAPIEPTDRKTAEWVAAHGRTAQSVAGEGREESGEITEASMEKRELDEGVVPPEEAAKTEPSADNMDSESMRSEVNAQQAEKLEEGEKSSAAKAGAHRATSGQGSSKDSESREQYEK